MLKTPRRRDVSSRSLSLSSSSGKRTLHLSQETIRALTADELPLAAGGSACPTGSWPTGAPLNTAQGC
jgi:hypothetical protein